MLTLVPVDTAVKAATVFGESKESAALIKALGFERPTEWDESDGDESEEGEEGGETQLRRDDGDDSDSGEHSGDRSEGEASVAATEQFDYQSDSDGVGADDGGEANGGGSSSAQGGGGGGSQVKKARVTTYTLLDVPASLQRELEAFTEWRIKPINRDREGVSVQPVTVAGNTADTLRLLGWLKSEHRWCFWIRAAGCRGSELHGLLARVRKSIYYLCWLRQVVPRNGTLRLLITPRTRCTGHRCQLWSRRCDGESPQTDCTAGPPRAKVCT